MPDILSSTLAFTYSNIVLIICQQILKNKHRANTAIKAITMENKDVLLYNNILIVTLNEKYFNPPSEMGEQAKQRRCIEY